MKSVITIGREYGCGGREIAKALAEELHVPCYDRELILLAAEKSGLSHEVLEKVDETASNSFLYEPFPREATDTAGWNCR